MVALVFPAALRGQRCPFMESRFPDGPVGAGSTQGSLPGEPLVAMPLCLSVLLLYLSYASAQIHHCARRRGRNRQMARPFDSRGVYRGRAFDQCILVLTSSHPTPFASAKRFWL